MIASRVMSASQVLRGGHIITVATQVHNYSKSIISVHRTLITLSRKEIFMKESILRDKSKVFAKDIVFLCRNLKERRIESTLVNQLLRCGTSVGANIHEAQYAQGTKDFISKLEIALKEVNESEFWLQLLAETSSISEDEYKRFQTDCIDLRRMLVSSVTTLKKKQ